MTFTEAAIEVLRLTGKPLHYKKITELAIQKNLLSHVGKTPEVTMSSRLATLVKKEAADSLIIKVKPGVFGLRDFGREVIEAAAAELPDDPNAAAEEASHEALDAGEPSEEPADTTEASAEAGAAEAAEKPAKKPSKPLPGSDVFPEEDDDDEPILGSLDKDEKAAQGADKAGGGDGGRRRRRRRRRGGPEGVEGGAESPRVESAAERPARLERPERGPREERAPREDRGLREDRVRDDRARDDRARDDRARDDRARDDRGPREERLREEPLRGDPNREHVDGELVGKDLADAVFTVMAGLERQPQTLARVAEQLVRRGRLAGDPVMLVPTIAAAVRADIARREADTVRPRFRIVLGRVTLTDWSLPGEAVRFEQDAVRSADRQREQVRQAFLRRVRELPGAGFAELLATWLNVEGVVALRAVRRPGAQPGELHLAGTLKRGHDETRLAIIARRDGREIGRERVIEIRGALHHYGSASAGWLITTGQVLSGAREEAAVPGTAPVACFDGVGLARAMERVGVGLRRHVVPLTTLDLDLLDNLQGNAPPQPRAEERPRDERREGREGREGGRRERFGRRDERDARELPQGAPEGESAEANPQLGAEPGDGEAVRPADAERGAGDEGASQADAGGRDVESEEVEFSNENDDLSESDEDGEESESDVGDEASEDESDADDADESDEGDGEDDADESDDADD
jgi:hypothetical protein